MWWTASVAAGRRGRPRCARRARRPDRRDGGAAGTGRRSPTPSTSTAPTSGSGAVFVFAAALLGVFMVVSGWAVLKVSVKAIWTTVILLPALWLGAIPGAPQRRARRCGVAVLPPRHRGHGLHRLRQRDRAGRGTDRGRSAARRIGRHQPVRARADDGRGVDRGVHAVAPHPRRPLGGAARSPRHGRARRRRRGWHGYARRGRGSGISAAVAGAKGCAGGSATGAATPWERQDQAAENAAAVHGPPQPGVDPVPNRPATPP